MTALQAATSGTTDAVPWVFTKRLSLSNEAAGTKLSVAVLFVNLNDNAQVKENQFRLVEDLEPLFESITGQIKLDTVWVGEAGGSIDTTTKVVTIPKLKGKDSYLAIISA